MPVEQVSGNLTPFQELYGVKLREETRYVHYSHLVSFETEGQSQEAELEAICYRTVPLRSGENNDTDTGISCLDRPSNICLHDGKKSLKKIQISRYSWDANPRPPIE